MYDVYAHGLLNIAASTAPDGDTGLFTDRDPYISCKSISQLTLTCGNVVLIPTPDILAGTVTGGPMAKRGWVLQDSYLPTKYSTLATNCSGNVQRYGLVRRYLMGQQTRSDFWVALGTSQSGNALWELLGRPSTGSHPLGEKDCTLCGARFAWSIPGEISRSRVTSLLHSHGS